MTSDPSPSCERRKKLAAALRGQRKGTKIGPKGTEYAGFALSLVRSFRAGTHSHTGRRKGRSYGELMKRDPNSNNTKRNKFHSKLRRRGKSACVVYALTDVDGNVRYVGQTRLWPPDRLKWHKRKACPTGSPVQRWILENEAKIIVIDHLATWDISEVIWIERHRANGANLLNVMAGGNGSVKL